MCFSEATEAFYSSLNQQRVAMMQKNKILKWILILLVKSLELGIYLPH